MKLPTVVHVLHDYGLSGAGGARIAATRLHLALVAECRVVPPSGGGGYDARRIGESSFFPAVSSSREAA